jgi:hypothetical protein
MYRSNWAAVMLLAAFAVSGCGDDTKPIVAEPSPITAEASSSASSLSLGPRDTVDAWLAAWTSAMRSGDATSVVRLSSPTCLSCQRLFKRLRDVYSGGGRLETDGWSASKVSTTPRSTADAPSFVMQVKESGQVLHDEAGTLVHVTAATTLPMRMTFELDDQIWVLSRLEILA